MMEIHSFKGQVSKNIPKNYPASRKTDKTPKNIITLKNGNDPSFDNKMNLTQVLTI